MKKLLVLLFSLFILSLSVNASDVYYCVDDDATGFDPKENFKQSNYTGKKFKILIDFENEDVLSRNLYMYDAYRQKCFYNTYTESLYCSNEIGRGFSINKRNLRFIRSVLRNMVGMSDDIYIAHGTCEKF